VGWFYCKGINSKGLYKEDGKGRSLARYLRVIICNGSIAFTRC
jgi:hypothetical protein